MERCYWGLLLGSLYLTVLVLALIFVRSADVVSKGKRKSMKVIREDEFGQRI